MCVPRRGEWSRLSAVLGSQNHSGRKGPQEVTPAPVSLREERWQLDLLDQLSYIDCEARLPLCVTYGRSLLPVVGRNWKSSD